MKVIIGSCFPQSITERPDFEDGAKLYYKRWDTALPEDKKISERQQLGLKSDKSLAGRLSVHEPIVHALDNRVLDRTVGPG